MFWLTGLLLIVVIVAYKILRKSQNVFEKQGIRCVELSNGYIDWLKALTGRMDFFGDLLRNYRVEPEQGAICTNIMKMPQVLVRDPELIQQLTIKDFDFYTDHISIFFNEDTDPLFGRSLFALQGKRWHDMRTTLSPAFTGSKMRIIFDLLNVCGDQLVSYFKKKYEEQDDGKTVEVEFRDIATRFTNDMIATTAFGVKVDSFENRDNVFYKTGMQLRNMSIWKFLAFMTVPKIAKGLGLRIFPGEIYTFFKKIVKETIDVRTKENIIRPDMIHLLLEARKEMEKKNAQENDKDQKPADSTKKTLTDDDITAQSFLFFFGGFETVSVAMCFAVYELAINPEIQSKLQEEIDQTLTSNNEKFTYDIVKRMKYLDMVVSETLRKWPPMPSLDRQCTKPHNFDLKNGVVVKMSPGMTIQIPVFGIHRDEKYYPNPEKFDPERFSDDNKMLIKPGSYLPFGSGPRNCIASRFALLETKVFLVHLLAKFSFDVIDKTPIPLVLKKGLSFLDSQDGFWVGVTPRK